MSTGASTPRPCHTHARVDRGGIVTPFPLTMSTRCASRQRRPARFRAEQIQIAGAAAGHRGVAAHIHGQAARSPGEAGPGGVVAAQPCRSASRGDPACRWCRSQRAQCTIWPRKPETRVLAFPPSVVVRVQWPGSPRCSRPADFRVVWACRVDDRGPVVTVTVWGWRGRQDVFRRRDHNARGATKWPPSPPPSRPITVPSPWSAPSPPCSSPPSPCCCSTPARCTTCTTWSPATTSCRSSCEPSSAPDTSGPKPGALANAAARRWAAGRTAHCAPSPTRAGYSHPRKSEHPLERVRIRREPLRAGRRAVIASIPRLLASANDKGAGSRSWSWWHRAQARTAVVTGHGELPACVGVIRADQDFGRHAVSRARRYPPSCRRGRCWASPGGRYAPASGRLGTQWTESPPSTKIAWPVM